MYLKFLLCLMHSYYQGVLIFPREEHMISEVWGSQIYRNKEQISLDSVVVVAQGQSGWADVKKLPLIVVV